MRMKVRKVHPRSQGSSSMTKLKDFVHKSVAGINEIGKPRRLKIRNCIINKPGGTIEISKLWWAFQEVLGNCVVDFAGVDL
jgi:hypothetical protein